MRQKIDSVLRMWEGRRQWFDTDCSDELKGRLKSNWEKTMRAEQPRAFLHTVAREYFFFVLFCLSSSAFSFSSSSSFFVLLLSPSSPLLPRTFSSLLIVLCLLCFPRRPATARSPSAAPTAYAAAGLAFPRRCERSWNNFAINRF